MSINRQRYEAIVAEMDRVGKYLQLHPATFEQQQIRLIEERAQALAELDIEWLLNQLGDTQIHICFADDTAVNEGVEKTLARYPQFIRDFHQRAEAILGEFWTTYYEDAADSLKVV